MEEASLLVAFVAGLSSFLLPCVLPLVPVYLASLYGPEIFDTTVKRRRFPVFLHALSFVFGFSTLFTIAGAGVGLVGLVLTPQSVLVRYVAGGVLIAFGVFMLAALKIPWLNYEKRFSPAQGVTTGYVRSFITGAVFSLAWTPCVGPVLGGILTLAWGSQTVWGGASLLAVYSLGLGLPFLAIGIAFDWLIPLIKRITRYSTVVYIFSGTMLIVVGILVMTNKLIWLQI